MLSAKKLTEKEWRLEVAKYPEANFLQSPYWKDLHDRLGMKTDSVIFYRDDNPVGIMLLVVKDAKRGRYLEISGGPLLDWKDQELISFATEKIKEIAKNHKAVFARIRPQLDKSNKNEQVFLQNGYKKAPMHLHAEHTSVLDLSHAEEDILKHMRRQTRYEVRKSQKLDIKVNSYAAKEKINEFIALQKETAKRQGFITSSENFLKTLTEAFDKNAKIYISTQNDQILNMGLVLEYGQEVDYFEAASSEASYKLPGAYALLWQSIKDSKKNGYKRFNFWGISYNKDPKNRYAGVTTFKRGFGGEDVTYLPAQDLIIDPLKYSVNWIVETARRKKRRL